MREPVRREFDETTNPTEMEANRPTGQRPMRMMDREPRSRFALGHRDDYVHFAPVWAGLFITVAALLLLTPIGVIIGLTDATAAAIWGAIALFLAFFIGGYVVGRTLGYVDSPLAGAHGLLSWALTITFALLISALVGGALLGPLGGIVGAPTDGVAAAQVGWGTFVGLLVSALACLFGAIVGNRARRPALED